jgi:hypothetical protein
MKCKVGDAVGVDVGRENIFELLGLIELGIDVGLL